jgi:predicted adenylyl cyclase CyaB
MPVNLELKQKVNSFSRIEKKLKTLMADFVCQLDQVDTYFTAQGQLLELRKEREDFSLIRYLRDEKAKDRFSEFEVIKISGKNPEAFLSSFLNIECRVIKTRKLYLYKNTRIHLDEVKSLGKFIELETLVIKGKGEAIIRYNHLIKYLDLDPSESIRGSYRDLILGKIKL